MIEAKVVHITLVDIKNFPIRMNDMYLQVITISDLDAKDDTGSQCYKLTIQGRSVHKDVYLHAYSSQASRMGFSGVLSKSHAM